MTQKAKLVWFLRRFRRNMTHHDARWRALCEWAFSLCVLAAWNWILFVINCRTRLEPHELERLLNAWPKTDVECYPPLSQNAEFLSTERWNSTAVYAANCIFISSASSAIHLSRYKCCHCVCLCVREYVCVDALTRVAQTLIAAHRDLQSCTHRPTN